MKGAFFPQIKLTLTMCIGNVLFGQMLNWSGACRLHLPDLEYITDTYNELDYVWIISLTPLGIALGVAVWAFCTRRFGPKRTLLCHTPLLLLSWFIMGYCKPYKLYLTAHIITSFCTACYFYTGEVYLISCVHRNNLKTFYALFKSSVMLGILLMHIIEARVTKYWLCIVSAGVVIICFALTLTLPDSPLYLIHKSELDAENSLKYYLGKRMVGPELNIIRQHMYFISFGEYTISQMLSSKVMIKTIILIGFTQIFKICTGYYIFILDDIRIFETDENVISPYFNNVIFGVFLLTSKFGTNFVHMHGDVGIRTPMMISLFLCSITLLALGTYEFLTEKLNYENMTGTVLTILCLFVFSYDLGMGIAPHKMIFAYTPHQIYDYINKFVSVIYWLILFVTLQIYLHFQLHYGFFTIWSFGIISLIGFIFVTIFIVDTKGKSLMNIQVELGGNPIGTRGSRRQRLPNPYETVEELNYLHNLIAEDLKKTAEQQASSTKI